MSADVPRCQGARKHTFDWLYWPTGAQPAGHSFSADLVIAVPDTAEITVTAEDEFVILACDGLWDVLEPQPSVDIIRQALRDGVSPMVRTHQPDMEPSL